MFIKRDFVQFPQTLCIILREAHTSLLWTEQNYQFNFRLKNIKRAMQLAKKFVKNFKREKLNGKAYRAAETFPVKRATYIFNIYIKQSRIHIGSSEDHHQSKFSIF